MLQRGIKLYNSAIAASIGVMLRSGNPRSMVADGSEWIDVAGQYLPLSVVEDVLADVAARKLGLDAVAERFNTLFDGYSDMAAAYALGVLTSLMGHTPSDSDVEEVIAAADNIVAQLREGTEADRLRDAGPDMMVGYGYDFRHESEHRSDFLNTRTK